MEGGVVKEGGGGWRVRWGRREQREVDIEDEEGE